MSIATKIKDDSLIARKQRSINASLLVTLSSDISRVGFDDGKRETTDTEAVRVIKKYINGMNEVIKLSPDSDQGKKAVNDIAVLSAYLPEEVSDDELIASIKAVESGGNIGVIMKALKEKYGSSMDAKRASDLIKSLLKTQ